MNLAGGLRWFVPSVLGIGAVAAGWLEAERPPGPTVSDLESTTIQVTSDEDAGRGSLRDALFAVASIDHPMRIVIRTQVRLTSPLPPVIHTSGLEIEGRGLARIDASELGEGPVMDIRSPSTIVRGLRVSGGRQGIRVDAAGVQLLGVGIESCDEGVQVSERGHGLVLVEATLEENRLGVRLNAAARGVRIESSRFREHGEAAVRSVAASLDGGDNLGSDSGTVLAGNVFESDRVAIILGNVSASVEDNEIVGALEAGIQLLGAGIVVQNNRLRDGAAHGIQALETQGVQVLGNELTGHAGAAILVRSGQATRIAENTAKRNGYGVVTVFGTDESPVVVERNRLEAQLFDGLYVVGGAPHLRGNRSLNNRGSGLHVLDYVARSGARIPASPGLVDNELAGNRLGSRQDGVYRERP